MGNENIVRQEIATSGKALLAMTPRAAVLHNKECPHGHQCRALDCMECMELYEHEESNPSGPAGHLPLHKA